MEEAILVKRAQSVDFDDLIEADVPWIPETSRDHRDLLEGQVYGYWIVRRHSLRMKVKVHDTANKPHPEPVVTDAPSLRIIAKYLKRKGIIS